jgi:hypothetical protein
VTESEDFSRSRPNTGRAQVGNEAGSLRTQARRAIRLAHAITDEKTTKNLEAFAAELLARADALERKGEN